MASGVEQGVVVCTMSMTLVFLNINLSFMSNCLSCSCTSFTVWLSILHVKHVAPDWLLAGCADEAGHMPGLL